MISKFVYCTKILTKLHSTHYLVNLYKFITFHTLHYTTSHKSDLECTEQLNHYTHSRDVVSVLNISVSRWSRDVFWNVSVSSRSWRLTVLVSSQSCDLMSCGHLWHSLQKMLKLETGSKWPGVQNARVLVDTARDNNGSHETARWLSWDHKGTSNSHKVLQGSYGTARDCKQQWCQCAWTVIPLGEREPST